MDGRVQPALDGPPSGGKIRYTRARSLLAAALGSCLAFASWTTALALDPLDFGAVNVGASAVKNQELPLTFLLSEMDPNTVLYAGGDSTIDFVLSFYGLTPPVTAGDVYDTIGEVTATYHLDLSLVTGTDFSVDDSDCLTGTQTCTAVLTFEPTATGPRTDTVTATILDLQVDSSDDLVTAMAPYLASAVEDELDFTVSGSGVPDTGTVGATVTVPTSAACIELSTTAIDFGTLLLGSVDAPATPDITVTNCSGLGGVIHARGTDATGIDAQWTLTDAAASCADALGLDTYRLRLAGESATVELSTLNKALGSLGASLGATHTAHIDTACPGSTGGGRTMALQIIFLATTEG